MAEAADAAEGAAGAAEVAAAGAAEVAAEVAAAPVSEYSGCFWQKNTAATYRKDQNEADGVYKLKTGGRIFAISDLEGVSLRDLINKRSDGVVGPKSADELRNKIFSESHSIAPLLEDIITVSADGEISFASATPEIPNPKNHMFCFLGDAWGVGPNNIELVGSLIRFKQRNPKDVVVLGGNRDTLRCRTSIETMLTKQSRDDLKAAMKLFNQNPAAGIAALKAVAIDFQHKVAADAAESSYIDYLYYLDSADQGFTIEKETTAIKRVDAISKTMGEASAWDYIVDEYLKMCRVDPSSFDREIKCKIYLHLVRVMSTNVLDPYECHPDAEAFKNIYQDHLDAIDLCALLQIEDKNEYVYLSHGSVVRKVIPTMPGSIFECQLPLKPEEDRVITSSDTTAIKNYKDQAIKDFKSEDGKENTILRNEKLTDGVKKINQKMKLIRESANVKDWPSFAVSMNSSTIDIYFEKSAGLNYTGVNQNITGSFGGPTMIQSGGLRERIHVNSLSRTTEGVDLGDDKVILYCSGHNPEGYMAAFIKAPADGKNKYYICVDVSKIDAQKYENKERNTCCCLILEPIAGGGLKKRIIGRFVIENKFISGERGKKLLPDKCYVHYDRVITDDDMTDPAVKFISLPELTVMTTAPPRNINFSYKIAETREREPIVTIKEFLTKTEILKKLTEKNMESIKRVFNGSDIRFYEYVEKELLSPSTSEPLIELNEILKKSLKNRGYGDTSEQFTDDDNLEYTKQMIDKIGLFQQSSFKGGSRKKRTYKISKRKRSGKRSYKVKRRSSTRGRNSTRGRTRK
jgi:hypothetical protein